MPTIADMPDLNDAMARLDAAEAAEGQVGGGQTVVQAETQTPPEQPAAQPNEGSAETKQPDSNGTGTSATTDSKQTNETKINDTTAGAETGKDAGKTPPGEKPLSKFAKDQQRRDTSWKELNAQKELFRKQQDEFEAQRKQFQQQQVKLQEQQARSRSKYTPEQYDQGAQSMTAKAAQLDQQADAFEARQEKLEADGKYTEAAEAKAQVKALREQADGQRYSARQAKDYAQQLRQNPEPTAQQMQERSARAVQQYTLQAAQKWPELAKDGSEFQKTVVGHLNALRSQGLDVNEMPALMYHVARLTAAETAAARVPGLEKELGEARAKVKEFEKLTAPGGGETAAGIKPPQKSAKTDDEEREDLRREAALMS